MGFMRKSITRSLDFFSVIIQLILCQLLTVFYFEVAPLSLKIFFTPALVYFYFYLFKTIFSRQSSVKIYRSGSKLKPIDKCNLLSVFFIGVWAIWTVLKSSYGQLMQIAMYGWDFVGHYGVFRWGINNWSMISTSEIRNSSVIESHLDSDYPQTWALWGSIFFKWVPDNNVSILKAFLIFSILTMLVAYLTFYISLKQFRDSRSRNSVKSRIIYALTFVLVLHFIAFCWSTSSPHFALATAFVFRSVLLIKRSRGLSDSTNEIIMLILSAYIIYPLTIVMCGIFLKELLIKLLINFRFREKSFLNLNLFFLAALVSIIATLLIKNERAMPLMEMLQSYGGVDFPSVVILFLILLVIIVHLFFTSDNQQNINVLILWIPVALIDVFLIFQKGFISYYGAKLSICFSLVFMAYLISFSDSYNLSRSFRRYGLAAFLFLSICLAISSVSNKAEIFWQDAFKSSLPAAIYRLQFDYSVKPGWVDGENLAYQLKLSSFDSSYKPVFTGGYPYLANMWLILINRYPSELWYGSISHGEKMYSPTNFISRDTTNSERTKYLKNYPYVSLILNKS